MTDAEIVIGIRGQTEGGKVVKRTLDDISASGKQAQTNTKALETQFNSLSSAGRLLGTALRGLIVAFGLRELQQAVDAYTNIQNRLKLVTDNASQLAGVTKELFNISNETRQSFESTAEVYARTALATKDLGLSQQQTLDFTKSLNQAVILSGASAAEASAGMIQLSQGLASGALRGDELRSVLEQLPAVADVIAKSLGVTRGELRKMGEDGKITAETIIKAFQQASGDLDQKFGNTVPTLGQAMTVLKNNFLEFVGVLDESTGASGFFAQAIIALGKGFEYAAKGVQLFAESLKAIITGIVTEAIVKIDNLSRSITSLFGLLGEGKSLTGLSEADIRGASDEKLASINDRIAPTVSTEVGKNVSKRTSSGEMSEAMKEAKKAASDLKQVIKDTSSEQETLLRRIKELEKLRTFAKTAEEVQAVDRALAQANEKLKTASDTIPGLDDNMDRLVRQTDRFADSAADAFTDFVTGAKSARGALSDLLGQMAKLFLQEGITAPLSDMFRGLIRGSGGGGGGLFGGLFSGIGSGLSSLFGFASGGSMVIGGNSGIDQNTLSLNGAPIANVGRGEVLSISPNQRTGGGQVVVNQTINVSTGVVETVRAEMVAMLPEFQQRTIAAVNEANLRGY